MLVTLIPAKKATKSGAGGASELSQQKCKASTRVSLNAPSKF
jgi:hypothetical protein